MAYVGRHSEAYLTREPDDLGSGAKAYQELGQDSAHVAPVPERARSNSGSDFYASIADYIGEVAGNYPDRQEQLAALAHNASALAQETGEVIYRDRDGSARPDWEAHVRKWIGESAARIIDTASGQYDTTSRILLFETDDIDGRPTVAVTNAITDLAGAPDHGTPGQATMHGHRAEKFTKTTSLPGVNLVSVTVFQDNERNIKQHAAWFLEREHSRTP